MFDGCSWLNAPAQWRQHAGVLDVVTDGKTDFWRETHYGFIRDNGHLFWLPIKGDFTATIRFRAAYSAIYDQAGLMVRIDEAVWLKAGIEQSDGCAALSSVITDQRSDWATAPYPGDPTDVRMRITIMAGVIRVQVSTDGIRWPLVRLAPFPRAAVYQVGPMCCTPERAGLAVRFSDFSVAPPTGKDLHDLT